MIAGVDPGHVVERSLAGLAVCHQASQVSGLQRSDDPDKLIRRVRMPGRRLVAQEYLVVDESDGSQGTILQNTSYGRREIAGPEEPFEVVRRYAIAFLETDVAGREDKDRVREQEDQLPGCSAEGLHFRRCRSSRLPRRYSDQ